MFECSICAKVFTNIQNLKRHQNVHDSEDSVLCDFCGLILKNIRNLDYHQKNVHKHKLVKQVEKRQRQSLQLNEINVKLGEKRPRQSIQLNEINKKNKSR